MPKKSAPKTNDIFAHFADTGRIPADPTPAAPEAPDLSALMARITALEADNRSLREAQTRYIPIQQPAPQRQTIPDSALVVSTEGLPDQFTDPAGFQRELATRINASNAARDAKRRQEEEDRRNAESRSTQIWNTFKTKYPDWAPYDDLAGKVAENIVARLNSSNVDVNAYLTHNQDGFLREVEGELRSKYGKLVAKPAPEDEVVDTAEEEAEVETSRTQVFGGQESGNQPITPRRQVAKTNAPDMFDDLYAIQAKSGFFAFMSAIMSGTLLLLMATTEKADAAVKWVCW